MADEQGAPQNTPDEDLGDYGDNDETEPSDTYQEKEVPPTAPPEAQQPPPSSSPPPPPQSTTAEPVDLSSTIVDQQIDDNGGDYDDDNEVLPDAVVKLYINDEPDDGTTTIVDAGIVDISTTTLVEPIKTTLTDSIDDYTAAITQNIYDQVNSTDVEQKKFLGSWSWHKILVVVLIALCIIGIILAIIYLVIGKKGKNKNKNKNKNVSGGATTSSTSQQGRQTGSPKGGYSSVPTNV